MRQVITDYYLRYTGSKENSLSNSNRFAGRLLPSNHFLDLVERVDRRTGVGVLIPVASAPLAADRADLGVLMPDCLLAECLPLAGRLRLSLGLAVGLDLFWWAEEGPVSGISLLGIA